MTAHLDDPSLRAFSAGALEPAALLAADEHLAACAACRTRAATLLDAAAAAETLAPAADSGHLTDDEMLEAASADAVPAAIQGHVDTCAACRDEIAALRRWTTPASSRPAAAPPKGTPRSWLFLAAAALVVVSLASWFALRPAVPPVAGLGMLPAAERARVEAVLASGRVTLPAILDELASDREVLMGPVRPGGFRPLGPVGLVEEGDRPSFHWTEATGARSYRVVIVDAALAPVAESPLLTGTTWTPPEPLPRGRTYTWQVTAETAYGTETTPAPPAPPARFHVLDAEKARHLDEVRRGAPNANLVLSILYAEAGLLDRAALHLEFVPPNSAYAALVRETQAAVDARRLPRRPGARQ